MKRIVISFLLILPVWVFSQNSERYTIHIGGPCYRCGQEKVISVLREINGVMRAQLDESSRALTFLIDPFRTSYEEVIDALLAHGYDANSQRADAFRKYDACCEQPRAQQSESGEDSASEDTEIEFLEEEFDLDETGEEEFDIEEIEEELEDDPYASDPEEDQDSLESPPKP